MGESKSGSLFLLWLGAAISIAEIVTGTLIAPLGFGRALGAIFLGHFIGCFLFLWPAGYLSARYHRTAIQATGLAFGKTGIRLFSVLNVLQLLGWTAVMIVNAQLAMNSLSQSLFNYQSVLMMSVIAAVLIILILSLKQNWLLKVNNWLVLLLAGAMLVFLGTLLLRSPQTSQGALPKITFGNAVELNVTMALSWLPLIGDYTQQTRQPRKISLVSVSGYCLGSLVMFILGLVIVQFTGQSDLSRALAQSQLGLGALLIVVFSTVTTTFIDAYSAGVNLRNLFPRINPHWAAIGITLLGLLIALLVSMKYYESFLYAIGAVFAPLFAIVFVSVFVLHQRLSWTVNFIWWLIGVVGYYGLQKINFFLGPTCLLLILLGLGIYLSSLITPKYPLGSNQNS
ncbi:putative hydroxymethylpyrimidine transporter CytX [Lactobacillus sp. DCY120]|uniref:Putative hydroxymethylpyrimidine transporter CytX n=1 Tax=Bombilactobacillus apium TaxID=2675299 RepID=A0A850R253_9LACO|nr:putative hydroxymethylpyrimidine transporter CytX [Bombilactobacillus apium]NVY96430.1 putative hydroxymethylpyrimidine transporter CytX [Bombilactobacillus apium]